MIDIQLNTELDKETYQNFKDFKTAGVDFGALIQKEHPLITPDNCSEYIDKFYSTNEAELNTSINELKIVIADNEKLYFKALEDLFGMSFDMYKYIGYVSIFNCNPRFVESKTFQFYYKKSLRDKIGVVFHEIMHFAFFEYCKNHLRDEIKDMDLNSGCLWELSEIFNVIVLNEPVFKRILGREEKMFYPNLKEKHEIVRKIWESNKNDLPSFVKNSLSYMASV